MRVLSEAAIDSAVSASLHAAGFSSATMVILPKLLMDTTMRAGLSRTVSGISIRPSSAVSCMRSSCLQEQENSSSMASARSLKRLCSVR